jgi:hypothetical protein
MQREIKKEFVGFFCGQKGHTVPKCTEISKLPKKDDDLYHELEIKNLGERNTLCWHWHQSCSKWDSL